MFSDKMVVHVYVLSPSMENRVLSQMDVAYVVTIEKDGNFDGDV